MNTVKFVYGRSGDGWGYGVDSSCGVKGTDGAAEGEYVPLSDYTSLEAKLVEARERVHELEVSLEAANNRIADLEEPVLVRTTRNKF